MIKLNYIERCFQFLCFLLFTYQAITLFAQYNKGRTVVNIDVGKIYDDGPPAITLCPAGLNIFKMAAINEQYRQLYSDYLDLVKNSRFSIEFEFKYNNHVLMELEEGNLSLKDLHDKYTYSFVEEHDKGNIKLQSTIIKENNDHQDISEKITLVIKPLESLEIYDVFLRKCLTYFSHLDPTWANLSIDLKNIGFIIKIEKYQFSLYNLPLFMQIHSPNDMPIIKTGYTK